MTELSSGSIWVLLFSSENQDNKQDYNVPIKFCFRPKTHITFFAYYCKISLFSEVTRLSSKVGGIWPNFELYLKFFLSPVFLSHDNTIARAEKFSLTPCFFRGCNTLRHHQDKAGNTSEIWLVQIACGILLTVFNMNGQSLEAVSERYWYKISVKP